ncbi:hypothetical protein BH23ACT11_BH23ACT11_12670 [soil metagenome]
MLLQRGENKFRELDAAPTPACLWSAEVDTTARCGGERPLAPKPIRLIGVDKLETVAPDKPVGCYGKKVSEDTKEILYERQTNDKGRILREGRLVRLEIPRIGDSEDAYGRTLAYVFLDTNKARSYEYLYNDDLIELGLARTTGFSHAQRREFERLQDEAKERGAGLWSACPKIEDS